MVAEPDVVTKVVIFNPQSGGVTPELQELLGRAFPNHLQIAIHSGQSLEDAYGSCPTTDDAEVVVAGGDGTVEAIARCLAGTRRRLGLVPVGTFNNFARALGIPVQPEAAIEVIGRGKTRPVTIGWVDERPFLEAAAIGVFGELIGAGEAAKELHYGDFANRLREASRQSRFQFAIGGDVHLKGRAESLVFANTPTIGALLDLADTTPRDPHLELEVIEAGTRARMLLRLLRALLHRPSPRLNRAVVREVRVATEPALPVYTDAFVAGETPCTIRADPDGLTVIVP
jgi:diacylglycerol kinase family enzyme